MSTQERRKAPRIDVDFVTVEVCGVQSTPELAEICPIINLSQNGMRFKSDRMFPVNQLLHLTFILPESIVIIRVTAEVIHYKELEHRKHSYGVQYVNIGVSEQKLINHFVQKKLNS